MKLLDVLQCLYYLLWNVVQFQQFSLSKERGLTISQTTISFLFQNLISLESSPQQLVVNTLIIILHITKPIDWSSFFLNCNFLLFMTSLVLLVLSKTMGFSHLSINFVVHLNFKDFNSFNCISLKSKLFIL